MPILLQLKRSSIKHFENKFTKMTSEIVRYLCEQYAGKNHYVTTDTHLHSTPLAHTSTLGLQVTGPQATINIYSTNNLKTNQKSIHVFVQFFLKKV